MFQHGNEETQDEMLRLMWIVILGIKGSDSRFTTDKSNLSAGILELNPTSRFTTPNGCSRNDCSSCGKQQNAIKVDCRCFINEIFDDDLNVLIDKLKNKCNYNRTFIISIAYISDSQTSE